MRVSVVPRDRLELVEGNWAMKARVLTRFCLLSIVLLVINSPAAGQYTDKQLQQWLKRFPKADANGDGRLTAEEADAFRRRSKRDAAPRRSRGVVRDFQVDPGWDAEKFPAHAVCYRTPKEIAEVLAGVGAGGRDQVVSYPKPSDGSLRIVGTGHSFMGPGYKTFPLIARAAGFKQPPLVTHTGGGMTGSARYKWEQENGIFGFDRKPVPKLLASIANAEWDVMMWGPYYNDRPIYYACWIEFCLKYNPQMRFYLSDAWPQLGQLERVPESESELTPELFERLGREKYAAFGTIVESLRKSYPGKVFVLPTSDAMVLAVKDYHEGKLPGVEGIHRVIGQHERSLWRDQLGHLGPGFGNLEGYVFYAAVYGRSPEKIDGDVSFGGSDSYPSRELDRAFRKIAWEAALRNPLSGVKDSDGNGVSDDRE